MSTEKKEKQGIEVKTNKNLPTYLVDGMVIHSRTDGFQFIRLTLGLPEPDGILEQIRFMVSDKSLQQIIDAICAHTGYYPKKTRKRQIKQKK